ncbi:hypothetical protein [Marinicellulosiphila megalodicopiae]|uniref:hypothetical protein n=1 Tax=Marinicellulosiphila megalodicopiae TaxID=2724896 RepID=UPI003BB04861
MQYSKSMIELVMQIRKWMPSDLKPEVKLANPDLFQILANHYHDNPQIIVQALIKELFSLAGENWNDLLVSTEIMAPQSTMRVYRGQISIEPKSDQGLLSDDAAKKPVRYYRGAPIYS